MIQSEGTSSALSSKLSADARLRRKQKLLENSRARLARISVQDNDNHGSNSDSISASNNDRTECLEKMKNIPDSGLNPTCAPEVDDILQSLSAVSSSSIESPLMGSTKTFSIAPVSLAGCSEVALFTISGIIANVIYFYTQRRIHPMLIYTAVEVWKFGTVRDFSQFSRVTSQWINLLLAEIEKKSRYTFSALQILFILRALANHFLCFAFGACVTMFVLK